MESSYNFSQRGSRIIETQMRVRSGPNYNEVVVLGSTATTTKEWSNIRMSQREAVALVYDLAEALHQHYGACPSDIANLDEARQKFLSIETSV